MVQSILCQSWGNDAKACIARILPNHSVFAKRNDSLVTLSSSRNTVSFSLALTTNRFPLSRCASGTKIVCPLESTVEMQPQLQADLLKLSVAISQYLIRVCMRLSKIVNSRQS